MKIVKKRKEYSRSTNTGFKGVSLHTINGTYEARVNIKGNNKYTRFYLGSFATIPQAVEARKNFITNLL